MSRGTKIEKCECCKTDFRTFDDLNGVVLCEDCDPTMNPPKPMKQWTLNDIPTFEQCAEKDRCDELEIMVFAYEPNDRQLKKMYRIHLVELLNWAQTHSPEEK